WLDRQQLLLRALRQDQRLALVDARDAVLPALATGAGHAAGVDRRAPAPRDAHLERLHGAALVAAAAAARRPVLVHVLVRDPLAGGDHVLAHVRVGGQLDAEPAPRVVHRTRGLHVADDLAVLGPPRHITATVPGAGHLQLVLDAEGPDAVPAQAELAGVPVVGVRPLDEQVLAPRLEDRELGLQVVPGVDELGGVV